MNKLYYYVDDISSFLVIKTISYHDSQKQDFHKPYFQSLNDIFYPFERYYLTNDKSIKNNHLESWARTYGYDVDVFIKMMYKLYNNVLKKYPEQFV